MQERDGRGNHSNELVLDRGSPLPCRRSSSLDQTKGPIKKPGSAMGKIQGRRHPWDGEVQWIDRSYVTALIHYTCNELILQ